MILPCHCKHAFQDERYGLGRRVHNRMKDKVPGVEQYRCTVCGTPRTLSQPKPEQKK